MIRVKRVREAGGAAIPGRESLGKLRNDSTCMPTCHPPLTAIQYPFTYTSIHVSPTSRYTLES